MDLCFSTWCNDLGLGLLRELVVPACRERGQWQSRILSHSAAAFCCLSNTSAVVLHILNPPRQVKQPVPPARECVQKAWMPSSDLCEERESCSPPLSENMNKALTPTSGTPTCLGWCHPCPARGQGAGPGVPHLFLSLCGQRWECLCACAKDKCVCSQICPGVISAVPAAPGSLCPVGFTPCDSVWLPQEGDSWQNLGSCSAGGRGWGMRPDRDTSHEVRSGLGAGH